MNKIAIVGHRTSGYRDVEALLHQCGMESARLSRREALSPQEISVALCKAHGVPPLEEIATEGELEQIQAGAVWNGMALDLLLGNIDQRLWGWADPQSIFLLDYWASIDPKLTFVLVYDEPQRMLLESLEQESEGIAGSSIERMLDNWVAYNAAMLRFYSGNPHRCLLVHSQQVRRAMDSYLQQLQPLLDTPLVHAGPPLDGMEVSSVAPADEEGAVAARESVTDAILPLNPLSPDSGGLAVRLGHEEAAGRYVAEGVLASHPRAIQLYQDLQAAASLPLDADVAHPDPATAWQAMARQRALAAEFMRQLQSVLSAERERAAHLQAERDTLARQYEEQILQLKDAQGAKVADAALLIERESLITENKLLLDQLQLAHEELERYRLGAQRSKIGKSAQKKGKLTYYGAADRIRRQLSYRLGAVMIQRSRSLDGWLTMPWALISEVRAFKKGRAMVSAEKLPPIRMYQDAAEAERVKQHLAYRLGDVLMKNAKSPVGWIKLPFALIRSAKQFRRDRGIGQS